MLIATINVLGLPIIGNIGERLERIVEELDVYDIILIQEDFLYHHIIEETLGNEYHIIYENQRENLIMFNSGLCTLIKKSTANVIRTYFQSFKDCAGILLDGYDCWANKGFQVIEININLSESPLFIVNLHMNTTNKSKKTQYSQLKEVIDFLVSHNLQYQDLIVGGDFNMTYKELTDFKDQLNLKLTNHYNIPDNILISEDMIEESFMNDYFIKHLLTDHYLLLTEIS